MKKILLSLFAVLSMHGLLIAQNLDGYKYVAVATLTYANGTVDAFGISAAFRDFFEKKGFQIISENNTNWPVEAKQEPCLILFCYPRNNGTSTVGITVKNCKNETILNEESTSLNWSNNFQDNYRRATNNCCREIDKYSYSFNASRTPQLDYPKVEQTNQTEDSIKNYLSTAKIDLIEGIYKSFENEQLASYKVGIIKQGDKYKAIIIESGLKQWKTGEVKAIFEQSSVKTIFSVKWYMANKTPVETFASIEGGALLSVELKNATGEAQESKLIKMFPSETSQKAGMNIGVKASGSGFFLSTNGIIATNAHVVEGNTKINVIISNEIGTFTYSAKVLLADNKNDVALLQISDDKFKELTSIPYGIGEKADVGEKVFTIGYPLNDVMGSNYKVTDGIISSKSGIGDDIRYYQISVPLQPGNSGGPLFNSDGNIVGITSARLNGQAIGTQVENVNYAVKVPYLLNLYDMLPNTTKLPTNSQVAKKDLQQQVKVLKDYVCLIQVN